MLLKKSRPLAATFQYISCCSLSTKEDAQKWYKERFNTSHVVVYPVGPTRAMVSPGFNTSHVVVYHYMTFGDTADIQVSIHLML